MVKTVFLTVPNGSVVNTFLMNGSVTRLTEAGIRVVILAPAHIQDLVNRRYADDLVCVEELKGWGYNFPRQVLFLGARVAYAKRKDDLSLELMERYDQSIRGWKSIWRRLQWLLIPGFKWIESLLMFVLDQMVPNSYDELFDKYEPDLVFSNNPYMAEEHPLLKEAARRRIKVMALTHSWDNLLTRGPMPVIPERLIVWNKVNAEEGVRMLDNLTADRVDVVGVPLFDLYHDSSILGTRDEFCQRAGLDPNKKIILFVGVTRRIAPIEVQQDYIDLICDAINDGRLADCQVYARMHPKVDSPQFEAWAKERNVACYVARGNDRFHDGWVPEDDDLVFLARTVHFSAVTVNVVSSLCLHGAVFGVPVISPVFDGRRDKPYIKSVRRLYDYEHNIKIHDINYVTTVETIDEYVPALRTAVDSESVDEQARQRVIDDYVLRLDGKSSERIENAIRRELGLEIAGELPTAYQPEAGF